MRGLKAWVTGKSPIYITSKKFLERLCLLPNRRRQLRRSRRLFGDHCEEVLAAEIECLSCECDGGDLRGPIAAACAFGVREVYAMVDFAEGPAHACFGAGNLLVGVDGRGRCRGFGARQRSKPGPDGEGDRGQRDY